MRRQRRRVASTSILRVNAHDGCPSDCRGETTLKQSAVSRKPSLTRVALAFVVLALIWLRWGGVRKGFWIDLDVYARGAKALIHDESLYSVSVHGLPFTYPPFAALLFVPFELLGDVGARWALTVASIGCYVLVVVVCARRLRMDWAAAGLVGLAGLAVEPL